MLMKEDDARIKEALIYNARVSLKDVIERFHHLEGEDRTALLFEHLEWLTNDWSDMDIEGSEYLSDKNTPNSFQEWSKRYEV